MSSGMVKWRGDSAKKSSSARKSSSPQRDIYIKQSASPQRSSSPQRDIYIKQSASPQRSSSRRQTEYTNGGRFLPRTSQDIGRREAKVERRRLQAEAKAHKLAMQTQQQELRHKKRMEKLEYSRGFKETHGASQSVYIAGGVGIAALLGYMFFS